MSDSEIGKGARGGGEPQAPQVPDIIERLREKRGVLDNRWPGPTALEQEAADEIDRLRHRCEPCKSSFAELHAELTTLRAAIANGQPSAPTLPAEEAAGKTATRLLDLWSEIAGAENFGPYHDTMAFLGKPNSVGWVWAHEVRFERDFDAEQERTRKLCLDSVTATEEENEELRAALANGQPTSGVSLHWLVDWVHLYATEGHSWISTKSADQLIALAARKPTQADADHFKTGMLSALAAAPPARSKMAQRAPNTNPHATWQTVPLPATSEMTAAAELVDAEMRRQGFANAEPEAIYYAMLDAAPSPPVQGSSEDCAPPDHMNDKRMSEDMTLADNVRKAALKECARFLEAEYPDNANTNAFCAAIRALGAGATQGDGK